MPRNNPGWFALIALAGGLFGAAPARAANDDILGFERTPPRLSYLDGEISFFRPGAPDWVSAVINTPLAPGDELYVHEGSDLEIQAGPSDFVRAGEETELALTGLEPDFLQFRLTAGTLSVDLRTVEGAQTFEIDTPNAAFTIERGGYYRVEVYDDTTTFITRRGGRATVALLLGPPMALTSSEEVVITGIDAPQIESYTAPELDAWDRWNYARTDRQIDAVSTRYVPTGVYGLDDLDRYGSWRMVSTYGPIWLPYRIGNDWAPYTHGRWLYDPYYGWSWVDAAPWGWAPYHYGRWVRVAGYWGWAPGPIVVRPYYSPALVAFYGGDGSVGISTGGPIGWVALGWGEPIFPWWGPAPNRRRAHWAGWGGPRVVNNVVIQGKTVIHVADVHGYRNARVRDAFVAVNRDQFGRRSVNKARIDSARSEDFKPVAGNLELPPTRESLAPSTKAGRRPPRETHDRPVVATRVPQRSAVPGLEAPPRSAKHAKRAEEEARATGPDVSDHRVHVVQAPRVQSPPQALERPPFGTRADQERAVPPPAPRYERSPAPAAAEKKDRAERRRAEAVPTPPLAPPSPDARSARPARPTAPEAAAVSETQTRDTSERELPGVPANRVYRGHSGQARPEVQTPAANPDPQRSPRSDEDRPGPQR